MSTALPVVVTITPHGAITEITVGGHSIASAIPRGHAELDMRDGELTRLDVMLAVDEIVVQAKEAASAPHA